MQRQRFDILSCAVLFIVFCQGISQAQGLKNKSIVLPWVFPKGNAKWSQFKIKVPELDAALHDLILKKPQKLSTVFAKKSEFWKFWMDSVVVGEGMTSKTLVVEPVSCGLGEKWLIGLIGVSQVGYELLGSSHRVLDHGDDVNPEVIKVLVEELHENAKKDRSDKLKVNLFSVSGHKPSQRESLCTNFLLSTALMDEARVIYQRRKEKHRALEFMSGEVWTKLKSNRSWSYYSEWIEWEATKEMRLQVKGHWTESVFGEKIRDKKVEPMRWALSKGKLELSLPEDLKIWLQSEEASLSEHMPEVVYQDRAWLYLNKGRAWGLKMKDRLSFLQGKIKGHVVGFYGPREGIKHKDKLVSEGAIIYIRKGQHLVEKGLPMEWDVVNYPTTWR